MVFLTLQIVIAVGLFVSLVISADSISGERERATLEGLLLTPTSRRQIVVGKFLAAVSPWPAVLVISIPYLALLSPDDEVLGLALLWGALLGSLLVVLFTSLGMLVSIWSNSNKASLSLSLVLYILFLIPTQLPGTAKTGAVGQFIQMVNPLEASNHFLMKVLVSSQNPEIMGSWLMAPVLFAVLVCGLLFWYASPALRLEGGKAHIIRASRGRIAAFFVFVYFLISFAPPIMARQEAASMVLELPLQMSINLDHKVLKTGDRIKFNTLVTYTGTEKSPPMVVALNIVNLKDGNPVDPEDWSPERAQYIKPLEPGQSAEHTWIVYTILEGDYMAYVVVFPDPNNPEATSQPVASSGIHLTVHPYTRLNPRGVLPLALGMPGGLMLGMIFLRWRRRRQIDMDGSE